MHGGDADLTEDGINMYTMYNTYMCSYFWEKVKRGMGVCGSGKFWGTL